jgi:hypothetical protein
MDDAMLDCAITDAINIAMTNWVAACEALVTAEQSGLPEAHLEQLADEVISCKLRLARERAGQSVAGASPVDPEQLLFEGMSIAS